MSGVAAVTQDPSQRIRVLHVDDEPGFSDLVATFLTRNDDRLAVDTATSVHEGLARLDATEVDCVVSDYDMPGQNGIDFLEAVRTLNPDLPFILYTGKGSEEIASDAITAGATDYLQKESGTDQYTVLANRIVNVVERERARTTASELQHYFSELANRATDILWLLTQEMDELVFITRSYEDVFGQSRATLQENPRAFLDATHPDDRDRLDEAMRALSHGEPMDIEFRVNESENYERYVWVKAEPIQDQHGDVTHVGGFTRDITDRKQDELDLRRAERQYEAMFEDPNILAAVLTPDGIVQDVNQTAMDYIEAEHDTILGEPFWKTPWWSDKDDLQTKVKHWIRRAADGEYVSFETEIVTARGTRFVDGVFRPVTDADGEVTALIVSDRDITEQKTHQQTLERMQDLLTQTESIADVGGWEIDTDTMDVFWSEHLFAILGVEYGEEPPLEDALDVYHEEDRPIVAKAVEDALASGDPFDVEVRFRRPDGEIRWLRVQGTPAVDDGEVVTLRGTVQDITDIKHREQALQQERDQLEEFASVVSHDLRNPLNVALGRLELAEEECASEHLTAIKTAVTRVNRITEDMLWLAREGRDIGSTETVVVRDAIDDAWRLVADNATHAELRYANDDHALATIEADYDRLCQLLENLLRNTIDHGGDDVVVTVGTVDDGFYLEDDGPGIPASERNDVFKTGYSTSDDGTGFGLSIVKRIVEAHGWQISITDGSAGGSRFEITGVTSSRTSLQ